MQDKKKKELTVVDLKTVFAGDAQDSGKTGTKIPTCTSRVPISSEVVWKTT